jgi:hypothetical protein
MIPRTSPDTVYYSDGQQKKPEDNLKYETSTTLDGGFSVVLAVGTLNIHNIYWLYPTPYRQNKKSQKNG